MPTRVGWKTADTTRVPRPASKKKDTRKGVFLFGAGDEARPIGALRRRHAHGHRNSPPDCCYHFAIALFEPLPAVFQKKKGSPTAILSFFGAGDEARTRYLDLGKVALYQMSYARRTGLIISYKQSFVNPVFSFLFRK